MDDLTLGFDPKMAGHAAASIPLFAAVFAFVKNQDFVPARFEALLATGVTAAVNALLMLSHGANTGVAAGPDALFPTLSASATGALLAMVAHAVWTKKELPISAPVALDVSDPVTDANLALTAARLAQPNIETVANHGVESVAAKRPTVRARPKKTRSRRKR